MRTTLSLEPDVALRVREELAKGASLKDVINHALRVGLEGERPPPVRYHVEPHGLSLRPGLDPDKLNQLLDDLEVEERLAQMNDPA